MPLEEKLWCSMSDYITSSTKILVYANFPKESYAGKLDRREEIDLIRNAFEKLGYGASLHTFFDWTYETLDRDVAQQKELTKSCDQLICLFLCHGEEGVLYDVENCAIPYTEIFPKVASIAPKSKKAFIIQSCRGEHYLDNNYVKKNGSSLTNADAKRDINGETEAVRGAGQKSCREWKQVLQDQDCQHMCILMSTLAEMVSVRKYCLPLVVNILDELRQSFDEDQSHEGYDWFEDVFTELCHRMQQEPAVIKTKNASTVPTKQVPVFYTNMADQWSFKAKEITNTEIDEPARPTYSEKLETLTQRQHGGH